MVADVNGDGKDDIICFHRGANGDPAQGYVWVALSNGSSFGAPQLWSTWFSINNELPGAGDFGGTGMAGVVDFVRGSIGYDYVQFSNGSSFVPPSGLWNNWFGVGSEVVQPAPSPALWP